MCINFRITILAIYIKRIKVRVISDQTIEGAFDAENVGFGNVSVAFGSMNTGMAKEVLDIANIGAAFQQMGGKRVAETVN